MLVSGELSAPIRKTYVRNADARPRSCFAALVPVGACPFEKIKHLGGAAGA
ncbi:hypothetical protein GCM10009535_42020 [Streptomyces thermocarboxydovorans]|uniref:Uncharacterized protein n=1 Tax=Streptomyces thermocarboxydovorans TaxID=59298 RepID=A0ABP3SQ57_9ACTN